MLIVIVAMGTTLNASYKSIDCGPQEDSKQRCEQLPKWENFVQDVYETPVDQVPLAESNKFLKVPKIHLQPKAQAVPENPQTKEQREALEKALRELTMQQHAQADEILNVAAHIKAQQAAQSANEVPAKK